MPQDTNTNTTSGAAIQRYKIGYHADEWGQRSSTPSGIPDASGSWVRYADHVTALAAGQATAAQAVVQDDLIALRKPTTSAELLWLLKLAHLVISDVDKTLEETFAPAQAAAPQGVAYAELPDEREMLKHALWLASSFTVHRYLMSNAEGRWSGAEKATCHDELCCLYVAVFRGVEVDQVRIGLEADWMAVHDATQELTDHMDVVIGFPLKGVPDYESLAPKFFAYFHRLAAHALRASNGQAPAGAGEAAEHYRNAIARARLLDSDLSQLTERGAKAWAGVDAQWLREGGTSPSANAGGPSAHIKEPYTIAEIKAKIDSNDYSAEMLPQHAMLLLDSASLSANAGQAGEYQALVCDYCGALTPDPWHSSGMLHGKMSKHIHSCDACAPHGQAPANPDPAYSAACNLATALFKKHFAHLPDFASGQAVWSLCDSTAGVLSQIDNMVSGLVQPPTISPQADSVQEDAALWHWLAEYLVGTRTDLDDEIVASETVNDLRKLVEAAIKQGATQ